jgi:hypothetical protein
MIKGLKKFLWIGCLLVLGISDSESKTHCFCKISAGSTVLKNFEIDKSWLTSIGHDKKCRNLCIQEAKPFERSSELAKAACGAGLSNGTVIRAYAKVGTDPYEDVQSIGKLEIKPNYVCTQPAQLVSDKCVKEVSISCTATCSGTLIQAGIGCACKTVEQPNVIGPPSCTLK